jgi:DNA-binding Lrp family transcriptional regulator
MRCCEAREDLGRVQLIAREIRDRLFERNARQQRRELIEHLRIVRSELLERARRAHERAGVKGCEMLGEPHHVIARNRAQHGARRGLARRSAAEGNQLIKQRQRVAHAAIGRLCDETHRRRLKGNPLGFEDLAHALGDQRTGRRFKLNCRQRDSTVTGSFCGSVVASRNFTCGGGSSRVFSSALNEWVESMCTSSMRYTL